MRNSPKFLQEICRAWDYYDCLSHHQCINPSPEHNQLEQHTPPQEGQWLAMRQSYSNPPLSPSHPCHGVCMANSLSPLPHCSTEPPTALHPASICPPSGIADQLQPPFPSSSMQRFCPPPPPRQSSCPATPTHPLPPIHPHAPTRCP